MLGLGFRPGSHVDPGEIGGTGLIVAQAYDLQLWLACYVHSWTWICWLGMNQRGRSLLPVY